MPLYATAHVADKVVVGYVLLAIAVLLSLVLGVVIARLLLACVFHIMAQRTLPFVFHWRRALFVTALFWCWYFTPAIAESRAATRVLLLLVPDRTPADASPSPHTLNSPPRHALSGK